MALADNQTYYWKLDESSGNAVAATGGVNLTNNGSIAYGTGKINNGAVFDNNNSKSFSSASTISMGTAGSISVWVNPTLGDGGYVFDGTNGDRYIFAINSDGSYFYHIDNTSIGTSAAGKFSSGSWYHVVITWDNSLGSNKEAVYINGSLDRNDNVSIGSSTTTLYVGNRYTNTGTQDAFAGTIDEIGIWSRALSGSEITSLYNSGNGTQYPYGTQYTIVAALGTYALTGIATAFNIALKIAMAQGSYALTGIAATFKLGKGIVADLGTYALTGFSTNFQVALRVIAALGTYTLTGYSATVGLGYMLAATVGTYVLTGFSVRFPIFWRNVVKNVVSVLNVRKTNT